MPLKSIEQARTKFRNSARDAAAAYEAGIKAVTENPMEKAASKEKEWADGCAEAARNNRFSKGCRRVSFDQWRNAAVNRGVPNFRTAMASDEIVARWAAFYTKFRPHLETGLRGLSELKYVPGDVENNIKRADFMARHNAKFNLADAG